MQTGHIREDVRARRCGMSFWRSKQIKEARKPHECAYCGRTIRVGERYSRETGTYEGEFDDYCLCDRCSWFVRETKIHEDELGCLTDDLFGCDIVRCPSCGSSNCRYYGLTKDKMFMYCECKECDEWWAADLSIEGLEYMMRPR